ncbi:Urb2/Npa2 family-domain-containing protein [Schizophyllum commune]
MSLLSCIFANRFVRSVHQDIRTALQSLFDKLQSSLQKHVPEAINAVPKPASIHVMAVWTSIVSLGKWLSLDLPQQVLVFGQPLARKVASLPSGSEGWTLAASASLSLMWVELSCVADEAKRSRLDLAFASYVLYVARSHESAVVELDDSVSTAVKALNPDDYGYVLELLIEALRGKQPGPPLTLPLLHAARVLLSNYPQNSLKHTQTFASECISIFNNYAAYISGAPDVILEVLRFVASYCTDRPAALRQSDLPLIFALLSNYLRPIRPTTPTTAPAVFHAITTITGALIRLRRDLLTATLPHLSLVLRQLLLALRRPRPQLGRRQFDALAKTFPSWIDPRNPLGAEEAAALARVLEALTTKTIPRTHKSGATNAGDASAAKATSLAPVFSRHSAPVLAAYADAANDPLCITPAEVRKALQPGLFALCGMLNEHTRDAMMVASLDAAGKVTMKALWREFERQRYVGKG